MLNGNGGIDDLFGGLGAPGDGSDKLLGGLGNDKLCLQDGVLDQSRATSGPAARQIVVEDSVSGDRRWAEPRCSGIR